VQALVYSLIAFSAAGLGALAYFGLTFTPANAILVAVVFACACVVLMERILRQRAENRLERAIEDLSRLLATDAQAGAVLGQRINAIADLNAGQRLETVEADISVLGTVIRQVAEAVAEVEDKVVKAGSSRAPAERTDARMISAPSCCHRTGDRAGHSARNAAAGPR
jgi:cyclic-di-GMP phosphodiesterase, flagellum assembly factor TipF